MGRLMLLVGAILLSSLCYADVEVIRDKQHGKVLVIKAKRAAPESDLSAGLEARQAAALTSAEGGVSPAALAAETFLEEHGGKFGISDIQSQLKLEEEETEALGTHIKYQQEHLGLEVLGGELIVHLDARNSVTSVSGRVVENISLGVAPSLSEEYAVQEAKEYWAAQHPTLQEQLALVDLYVVSPSFLDNAGDGPAYLTYEVRLQGVTSEFDHYCTLRT